MAYSFYYHYIILFAQGVWIEQKVDPFNGLKSGKIEFNGNVYEIRPNANLKEATLKELTSVELTSERQLTLEEPTLEDLTLEDLTLEDLTLEEPTLKEPILKIHFVKSRLTKYSPICDSSTVSS